MPKPGVLFECGKEVDGRASAAGYQFYGWAKLRGVKCSDMFAILAAQLR